MNEVKPSPAGNRQNTLLNRAMRLLSQRAHSEAELRRKLTAPPLALPGGLGVESTVEPTDPAMIEQVIAYCYQHNWLDDRVFANRFIASRSRKGYGAQRICLELMQKGVEKAVSRAALAECAIDWCEQAKVLALRKFGDPLPAEWKERAKVQSYLRYRGFFQEEIQSIYRDFV